MSITALPWTGRTKVYEDTGDIGYIYGADHTEVACLYSDNAEKDLAFIVKACNIHEELVAALRAARPLVLRSRDETWQEVLSMVDAALVKVAA